jgi:hypothetical protein
MLPLSILKEPINVYRKSSGQYVNGRWREGVETLLVHKHTSVQPVSAADLQMIPEGESLDGAIRVFDIEELFSQNIDGGVEADVIEYYGRRYKVVRVDPWRNQIMDYYEALAVLERQSTGA